MAAIDGIDGSVTFASGFVTNAHGWRINDGGDLTDTTPFGPTGNSRTRGFAIANWEGDYRCWQEATVSTGLTVAGGYYSTNAHAWSLEMTAEDLPTTPFGASYNTRMAGLLSASGSYDCYLDDTTALPNRGDTDTITLTIDAGMSYAIPIVIGNAEARVEAAGGDRHVTVNWESNGDFTETGAVPVVGVGGAAVFVAEGARQYSGDILIISVGIDMASTLDIAEFSFGFVGNGALTAA